MADNTNAIEKTRPTTVEAQRVDEGNAQQSSWTYRPHVDIVATNDEYLVVADIPGADQDTIDVTYQEDVLSIQAQIAPRGRDATAVHRQEYGVGGFHRRFVVEAPVDAEKMSAEYDHGVLTVRLPKAEQAKGRRIEVKSA
jgi:HSP20 family protein